YLASQIDVYQSLAETYVKAANPEGALGAVELASAKYLIEQLESADDPDSSADREEVHLFDLLYDQSRSLGEAGNTGKTADPRDDAQAARRLLAQLPAGTAIVRYANTARDRMIVFVVTSSGVSAVAVETGNRAAQTPETTAASPVFADESSTRGLQRIAQSEKAEVDVSSLTSAIRSHRNALAGQAGMAQGGTTSELGKSGNALYRYLIAPVERQLAGVSSLWIVPDGALALLPFESFVLPDGRYLVEAFDIRYVQSLRVAQILRDRTYDQPRKPLLALGGAIYEKEKDPDRETNGPSGDKERKAWEMALAVTASRSSRQGEWKNLPGTLAEVEAIGTLFPDARVLTGDDAAESRLKAMATAGELANYRVLHFATHGMVVPDSPELSALVLSQTEPAGADREDGFLSMGEVAKLRLAADLVTLSACETGLGRIYSGEGVVGLGQAFLVAGANGVTLSLWQVADESTKDLMVAVYGLVEKEGMPFAQALTRVKREFIKNRKYSHPFYWAPFVYYGQ
ncbi:MAG: CHAT domain-containing protein, partial [Lentisphaeria bacterium]|nr:CHAT domain-containing protein [Lentisphaeria bacterium]